MSGKSVSTGTDTGKPVERSDSKAVDAFVRQARAMATKQQGGGRLVLALDATMSRQPTWDLACNLQGEMFDAVGRTGGLNVQLVYFRGFGECRASKFVTDTGALKKLMSSIDCRAGHTQIGKVLSHTLKETARSKVSALVYIGDAVEESVDDLADKAGQLGLLGTPVFVFQEGRDDVAGRAMKEVARLSKGAWFRFDRNAADHLARLLSSIAVFATGGLPALQARDRQEDRLLIEHLRGGT
ncbi:VWA domain-containing protein [Oryzicola mucosus]|uniref:VWA domain-containing protein n=1 Tax=Oryzicola mucosus TaxID=2767425 RepID=A0A8J6U5I5_9HYPH|nr:VWA domain-containing protein [Oryzicola mucosus]MBD0416320.1 VWA domain-containing protein [Oryzicola mucosus]